MKLFGRYLGTEKRNTVYSTDDIEFLKILGIDGNGVGSNRLSEIVYFTCLKTLSDKISSLPIKVYKNTKNGIEQTDHHLNYLLKTQPNKYYNASIFWSSIEYCRNHFGNGYAFIDIHTGGKNAGKVKSLLVLNPDKVNQIWVDDKGIFNSNKDIWYVYTDQQTNKQYKINSSQMLHFKNWITKDGQGLQGLSVREILNSYIEQQQAGAKFVNGLVKGGMITDKIIVQYTGNLDTKAEKVLKEKLENFSMENGNKWIPLPLGITAQNLSSKLTDSQFIEITKYNALSIASAFSIKPNYINDFEKSSYSNSEMQMESLYKDTLLPIIQQYEQELLIKLLTQKEKDEGYYIKFNVDAILRAAFKQRIDTYAVAVNNGILTPNECRQLEDRSPLEGGDDLIGNGNYIPLKMAGTQWQKGGVKVEE